MNKNQQTKTIVYFKDPKGYHDGVDVLERHYVTKINMMFKLFDFNKIIEIPKDFNNVSNDEVNPNDAILHYLFSIKECGEPTIDYGKLSQQYINMLNCHFINYLYNNEYIPYTLEQFERLYILGLKLCQNLQNYGVATIEDWCLENWGSISNSVKYRRITWEGYDAITFTTYGYKEPHKIYEKLARWVGCNDYLCVVHANNSNNYNWCVETYENGKLIKTESNGEFYSCQNDINHEQIMDA